jgi:predicted nucleotidyltransferase component of viral defense system
MGRIDCRKLYVLQDLVLDRIFSFENDFYLTGGTCLSRFYQEKRYSDDLDFFVNNSSVFGFTLKKIKALLAEDFKVDIEIEAKDFCRLKIDDYLQVDFIHDRAAYYKDPVILENGYRIDNVENILSNKLTAIIGRDDPKDIFDIYLIAKFYSFDWSEIIQSAKIKSAFNLDDLIARLKSFPKKLLDRINLVDDAFLDNFPTEFTALIEEISEGNQHTLYRLSG